MIVSKKHLANKLRVLEPLAKVRITCALFLPKK